MDEYEYYSVNQFVFKSETSIPEDISFGFLIPNLFWLVQNVVACNLKYSHPKLLKCSLLIQEYNLSLKIKANICVKQEKINIEIKTYGH